MQDIGGNLERVLQRIGAAADSVGRDAREITLLAVSKRIDNALIEEGLAAGVQALGESRVQEAQVKIPEIQGHAEWHFIGPLQSNKAAKAARLFDVIHSVRGAGLIQRVSTAAAAASKTVGVYIQVEPSAHPPTTEVVAQVVELCREADGSAGLRLEGLMTMAPYDPAPESARPYFAHLKQLRDELAAAGFPGLGLSMGMSGDFEVAIEEGATIVRVGTAIFGDRPS